MTTRVCFCVDPASPAILLILGVVYRELCDRIQDATENDIRRWKQHAWKRHPFKTFFSRLARGVTTAVPKAPKSANQAPTYDDTSSSDGAASTSDKEDKPEYTARSCLEALVEDILTEAEDVSVIDQDWEFAVLVSLPVNDSSGIG